MKSEEMIKLLQVLTASIKDITNELYGVYDEGLEYTTFTISDPYVRAIRELEFTLYSDTLAKATRCTQTYQLRDWLNAQLVKYSTLMERSATRGNIAQALLNKEKATVIDGLICTYFYDDYSGTRKKACSKTKTAWKEPRVADTNVVDEESW